MALTRPAREDPPLDLLQQLSLGRGRFPGRRPPAGAREHARPPASTLRAQAALSRLAHLEGRLRGRRAPRSGLDTPSSGASKASSAPSSRAGSPPSPARGAPGRRFLKKRAPSAEAVATAAPRRIARPSPEPPAPRGSPDSDEDEVRELLGGLEESSREKGQSPAEPSAQLWGDGQSPSLSAPASLPTLGSGTCTPHAAPSLSDSVPFSGEEDPQSSVAEPGDTPLAEDSEDSHDFRVHILSLSDLEAGSPQFQRPEGSEAAAGHPPEDSSSSSDREVLEQLGEVSAGSGPPTARSPRCTYSEDFESSEAPHSLDHTRAAASSVPRVVLKDTAVQTPEPAFAYQWGPAAGTATMGPSLGGAYVDPVPIASHVVSPDAVEALTAYSPAALALNDLLRQQLSLSRRFAEASRELHGALLQALGPPAFRYHTLQGAREYIRRHRPTRLSMEAALEEVKQELEAPGAWV